MRDCENVNGSCWLRHSLVLFGDGKGQLCNLLFFTDGGGGGRKRDAPGSRVIALRAVSAVEGGQVGIK
jgi:hypothetical protein